MLDPGPNPVPEPERIPVSLKQKIAVPACPVPENCNGHPMNIFTILWSLHHIIQKVQPLKNFTYR